MNFQQKSAVFTAFLLLCASAQAIEKPVDLAVESYKYLELKEMMLQGAIQSGTKADYQRFIWKPTVEIFQKWPPLAHEEYAKFRPCQFALDSFRVYSEVQFNEREKMDKNRPYYKDYFGREKECVALLKGKI